MEFEWDGEKARANLAKHGVSFVYAQLVFADDNRIEELDDLIAYGEERWKTIGLIRSQFFAVIYTQRGNVYRIISARRATSHEQQNYLQQTSS
jgi:uncharacterized protein